MQVGSAEARFVRFWFLVVLCFVLSIVSCFVWSMFFNVFHRFLLLFLCLFYRFVLLCDPGRGFFPELSSQRESFCIWFHIRHGSSVVSLLRSSRHLALTGQWSGGKVLLQSRLRGQTLVTSMEKQLVHCSGGFLLPDKEEWVRPCVCPLSPVDMCVFCRLATHSSHSFPPAFLGLVGGKRELLSPGGVAGTRADSAWRPRLNRCGSI